MFGILTFGQLTNVGAKEVLVTVTGTIDIHVHALDSLKEREVEVSEKYF